jgi:predicted RNase H-like nuclease (RuvC/YqgF family)
MRTFVDIMQDIVNGGTRSSNQITISPANYHQELVAVRNQVANVSAAQVADREAFKKGIQQLARGTAQAFDEVYQEVDGIKQNQQQMAQRLEHFHEEQQKINHGHGEYIRQNREKISALEKRAEAAEKRIAALEKQNADLTQWCQGLQDAVINCSKQQKLTEKKADAGLAALKKAGLLK